MTGKARSWMAPSALLLLALALDLVATPAQAQRAPRATAAAAGAPPEAPPGTLGRAYATLDRAASSVEDALELRALGPLFNAGEAVSKSVKPLQDARVRQQLGELVNPNLPYARRSRQAFQRFSAGVQKAGNALEKAGKGARWYASGNAFDNLANLSEGLGSLYERDMVGVAQTGANTGLSGASAVAGAWPGAKVGAGVGMVLGGPPGAALGGVVGGVGGAIAGSYAYDVYLKPELDKAANSVSVELQRRQEQANKFLRRIESDRVLLQQHGRAPLDILFERDGRSPFATLSGVDGADLSDSQAERIHQRAEEIRSQQMVQRVQALPSDGIDARLKALRRLHERANDSEGRARLTREMELLTQRQRDEQAQADETARQSAQQRAQALAAQQLAQEAERKTKAQQEQARLLAQQAARQRALDQVKLNDEERARRKSVEDQRRKAAEEDRKKAQEQARREAQEQARQDAARRKAEEAARLCGPNGRPDGAGGCFCDPGFESVGGRCVKTTQACATHGDCPAGFLCSAPGLCVADTRGSGQEAVRLRAELEQRRLAGASASALGSTPGSATSTTAQGGRFGLSQMPGSAGHVAPALPAGTAGTTRSPAPPTPAPTRPAASSGTGTGIGTATTTAPATATPTPISTPVPTPTPAPAPAGGWYVFEVQFSYTDEQRKQHCTSTNRWTVSFATPAQADAFLATLGPQALKTVHDTHPEATLLSSRRVSGPSLTTPAARDTQGAVVSLRCQ